MDSYYTVLFHERTETGRVIEHIRCFDNLTSAEALWHEVINKPWCLSAVVSWGGSILDNFRRLDNAETDDRK